MHLTPEQTVDLDAYLDSQSIPTPFAPTPTCGQCKHFEIRREWTLEAPGMAVCKLLKTWEWQGGSRMATLKERDAFDPICDRYTEEVEF